MIEPPEIPGISNLKEIGRSSLVAGYRGEVGGVPIIVEVLLDDNDANRLEFYRTSALQSRMGHPGMPPIQYSGVSDGRPYRIREYVEGRPVSGLFTDGPLAVKRLISTARALASTLNALHRRGMAHTEIHPHCLRVDSSGLIRFVDTGRGWPVLRPLPACERSLALPYLAPEVGKGSLARTESDIFSLGAVLAALAVGKPAPPEGVTNEFLRETSSTLPPALRVLLRSMLDKDPAKRPEAQTVTDCLTRIDELNSLLRLKSWKPAASANTFLGHHAYPLIGRDKELGQLMVLWQRVTKGTGLSVTILGPKGSGRRRLVEELRRGVQRSGGITVRHRLEADPEKPTLIVNYSHKGRQGHDPDNPWLSVNFAQTGPVPDQHTIELEALPESDCLRLAESYLASPADEGLRQELFSRGATLPSVLLQQLDDWCEEGVLRPAKGRWLYNPDESLIPSKEKKARETRPTHKEIKLDYDTALKTIVELWATSLQQDDPMVSALVSFCTALKCERADLYQIINNEAKYVCASSFGRHRLDQELLEQVLMKFEPVWSGPNLLFPLRCGVTFCGFISLQWWAAGVPRFDGKLFQLLAMATSPIALTLGQTQLEDRRLKRITLSLEELLKATSEPADIMARLSQSLRRSLEFEILSAWLTREEKLDKLLSDPPGQTEADGTGHERELFREPFETRQQVFDDDHFLAIPLVCEDELLGGIVISRDPSTPFTETEAGWAAALTKVAESALLNARNFGEQTRLLKQSL
jgi:eukaryotic-like serine/threonine-protein kinase